MPTTLTDDPTSFVAQTAPVAGEARTAQSVADPFQRAANRAAYVKTKIDFAIDQTSGGVRQLQWVGNLSSLLAIPATGRASRMVVYVATLGLFQWNQSVIDDVTPSPRVARPSDVAAGAAGRWVWDKTSANIANGVALLDANAKVAGTDLAIADGLGRITARNVKNGIVAYGAAVTPTNQQNITTTSMVVIANSIISFGLMEAGDIMTINYNFWCGTSIEGTDLDVTGSEGGNVEQVRAPRRSHYGNGSCSMLAVMVATAPGTMVMALRAARTVPAAACAIQGLSYEAKVIRP